MSLFSDPWNYSEADSTANNLMDIAGRINNGLQYRAQVMRQDAAALEAFNKDLQLELGRLVQAVADLGRKDHPGEHGELRADDHRQRT